MHAITIDGREYRVEIEQDEVADPPWEASDVHGAARHEADEAARLVKHIVQNVSNRHIAVVVSQYSGCPAYINYRRL